MKKNNSILVIAILAMCVLFACNHVRRGRHNISISFSESYNTYKMQAYYNEQKTAAVQQYIKDYMRGNQVLDADDDYLDASSPSGERTHMYIKSSPGHITIKINKRRNSYASYQRVKGLCEGVAEVLKTN